MTPMMRQYCAIKRELPKGMLLMFRLGDFFELFGEDAVVASPILGASLTTRGGTPMCNVPFYAIDTYLAKLVKVGKSVAMAEHVGEGRREVTRVIIPGGEA